MSIRHSVRLSAHHIARTLGARACLVAALASLIAVPSRALELPEPTVTRWVLENGLIVLVEEDHAFPRVAVEVRVKGGSCDDTPWIGSGLAHLMEHMLFKGTERRKTGTIETEVRRYEGDFNAFTSYDYTGYSLSVSSAHTKPALDLMSDVLFHSVFDPAELTKEQEVIHGEMRMNRDDPDRRLHWQFWQTAFQVHPYRHPVIGYAEVFDRLTRDDVLAFYQTRYVPNNMVLAIAGDVHTEAVRAWVAERFGGVPRGVPFDWGRTTEPPQLTARRHTEQFPVQQAQLMLGFHSTRLQDEDLYPLDVLAQVLGAGESARLERKLRRELELVHAVGAWNATPQDPGLFMISATVDADKVEPAAQAALAEIRLIQREGVTAEELNRAKRAVLADFVRARQTLASRASDLATNELLVGDHRFSRVYVDGIQRVTSEDIRRAVQRHLTDNAWTMATLVPPTPALTADAAARAPEQPPLAIKQAVLRNGVKVVVVEDHRVPLVALRAMWHGGVRAEDPEVAGLSNLTAQMLRGGTEQHTSEELAALVENKGGGWSSFSGKDGFGVAVELLAEDAPFGLELLREVMTASQFPAAELERERARTLAQIRERHDDIFQVTGDKVRELLLRDHPYARHPLGTAAAVEILRPKDCQVFFQQFGVPSQLVLAIAGDVKTEQVLARADELFGTLPAAEAHAIAAQLITPRDEPATATVHLPGRQQAIVTFGYPGVEWTHRDRYALDVVEALFSGSGGRLYQKIREQAGLSYTLGASHVPGELGGYFLAYVATEPAQAERVARAVSDEVAALIKEPPANEELELAKMTLRERYFNELQQVSDLAARAALNVLVGLSAEEMQRYPDALAKVSRQDVARVLRAYLGSTAFVQVQALPPPVMKSGAEPSASEIPPVSGEHIHE